MVPTEIKHLTGCNYAVVSAGVSIGYDMSKMPQASSAYSGGLRERGQNSAELHLQLQRRGSKQIPARRVTVATRSPLELLLVHPCRPMQVIAILGVTKYEVCTVVYPSCILTPCGDMHAAIQCKVPIPVTLDPIKLAILIKCYGSHYCTVSLCRVCCNLILNPTFYNLAALQGYVPSKSQNALLYQNLVYEPGRIP
jgi:hypothetical protein